jgi:hypothetical protein
VRPHRLRPGGIGHLGPSCPCHTCVAKRRLMTGLAAGELGGSDFAFVPLQLDKHGLKDRCLLRHKLLQIEHPYTSAL